MSPQIVRSNFSQDSTTDWLIARTFKELLEAIQLTGAGFGYIGDGYQRLVNLTMGSQYEPQTLGFYLKYWMDLWAAGTISKQDLGNMELVTRMLKGSNA